MPRQLHAARECGFEQIQVVAVAVRRIAESQNHAAIIRRVGPNPPALLHLYWHKEVKDRAPNDRYLWVEPDIAFDRLLVVAAYCELVHVASLMNQIPFAFSSPVDCFDEKTGAFLFSTERLGLTCASFVLAIFHRAACPLIEYKTWPRDRPDDIAWQQRILTELREVASEEFVAKAATQIGNERYRPEEVVAAAMCDVLPASYSEVSRLVPIVIEALSIRSSLDPIQQATEQSSSTASAGPAAN